jgi:sugar lactone lactonase YvrE
LDTHGNLFIADSFDNRIRKVSGGIITSVAGNGSAYFSGDGGPATLAGMGNLTGVGADAAGDVFVEDLGDGRIRKAGTNGLITTYAGTGVFGYNGDGIAATNAELYYPEGLAADKAGNLYIADDLNNRIRKINTNGIISTMAGTGTSGFSGDGGPAASALLSGPTGVALDSAGNLYIADAGNQRIRRIDTNVIITTVAGNGAPGPYLNGTFSGDGGQATNAGLSNPSSVTVDAVGNLFIADTFNRRVRRVGTNGIINTYAGNGTYGVTGDGGLATNAEFKTIGGLAVDSGGNLFIADSLGDRIREVGTNGIITTFAGNGTTAFSGDGGAATNAGISGPYGIAFDPFGNLLVTDPGNQRVRKVTNTPMGPVLTLTAVTAANAGNYQVVVTGKGGSVTSTVASFTVATAPQVYQTSRNLNGSLALSFVSQPGSTNLVLSTTNLVPPIVWVPISTNVAATNGDWQFTDTNTPGYRLKFYRSDTPSPP